MGPERGAAIAREFAAQREYLDELLAAVEVVRAGAAAGAARGKICFTGKMPEKRSYYEELARRAGFEPADAVTRDLALLVAADPEASGGKLDAARKHGVRIVALGEFLKSLDAAPETPEAAPETEYKDDLFGDI